MAFVRRSGVPMLMAALLALTACNREPAGGGVRSLSTGDVLAPASTPSGEGRRIALVIGNGRYATSPLVNPANDADLVSDTLAAVGFDVQLVKDGDQRAMKRAIQAFGASLEAAGPSAVGLFYYAGHGVQMSGRNYLIPVAAEIQRDADVEIEAVSADWVIEQMRFARNRLNFVILDACRNNPFARSFRSADSGLAKMDAPAGVLIAYSTAPGDVASDGSGRNSPYSAALATFIRSSDQPAELMFKQVRDSVRRETREQQTPWESSSLTGENFYFTSRGTVVAAATPPTAAAAGQVTRETPQSQPAAQAPPSSVQPPVAASAEPIEYGSSIVLSSQFDPEKSPGDLCTRATGDWRVESDVGSGTVRLEPDRTGKPEVSFRKPARSLKWTCDVANRRVVVRFDNGTEHTLTVDYIERWLFGSDFEGNAVGWTR